MFAQLSNKFLVFLEIQRLKLAFETARHNVIYQQTKYVNSDSLKNWLIKSLRTNFVECLIWKASEKL